MLALVPLTKKEVRPRKILIEANRRARYPANPTLRTLPALGTGAAPTMPATRHS